MVFMEEIVSPPITIIEILKARAKNEPDVEGFYFLADENKDRVPLTYRELHDQALSIASVLLKTMKKGERAILLYPPGPEFIAAFFGCLYAGIIAVPAYPPGKSQNLNRLKSIIDDASASCVLTEQGIYRQSKKDFSKDVCLKNIPWLCTDNMVDDEVLRDDDLSVIAADDIALLQYTSGSTGSPKGVIVSHCNIMNNQMVMEQALSADRDSVSISWLPHFHDMGLMQGVIQPVYVGFPVTLMPPAFFSQKPIRWLRAISKYQATISGAPNFAYDLCVDTIKDEELSTLDLGGWKLAFNGAEPVISRTLERFYQKFKACGYKRNVHFPCYGVLGISPPNIAKPSENLAIRGL
jgi:acyl-CoA synthetase (AMP-forming)/AMP-acid ligase II